MAQDKPIFCRQISFTNTADIAEFLGGVSGVVLHTSADCYVDFDQPTAPTTSFKLLAANTADTTIDEFGGTIQNLHARGATGSGTLYVVAFTK